VSVEYATEYESYKRPSQLIACTSAPENSLCQGVSLGVEILPTLVEPPSAPKKVFPSGGMGGLGTSLGIGGNLQGARGKNREEEERTMGLQGWDSTRLWVTWKILRGTTTEGFNKLKLMEKG